MPVTLAVNKIKNVFKQHVDQNKLRKQILSNLLLREEQNLYHKNYTKGSAKALKHQELMEAITLPIYLEAREAVIEKYITLCKNAFIDEVMQWRLKYLACRLSIKNQSILKLRIGLLKE